MGLILQKEKFPPESQLFMISISSTKRTKMQLLLLFAKRLLNKIYLEFLILPAKAGF